MKLPAPKYKWYNLLPLLCASICSYNTAAQGIPSDYITNWSTAGLAYGIPRINNTTSVLSFGALPNSSGSSSAAFRKAIDYAYAQGGGAVYIAAGKYYLDSPLVMRSGVVLRGAGADSTELIFDFTGQRYNRCISIEALQNEPFYALHAGYELGSSILKMDSAKGMNNCKFAEIQQTNGSWDYSPAIWAANAVGQILKLDSSNSKAIYLAHPLRISYADSLKPECRCLNTIENVGLECFKLTRIDSSPVAGFNIYFYYAVNSWIKGVECNYSNAAHVFAEGSTNLEIRGCYFHDAFDQSGTSTRGYGVTLLHHTGECLVEDNIFESLRHAMMIKQGANGNVFGYNYSTQPIRTEVPSDATGDISGHGHFAYRNLFEGNVVQNIIIDNYWGPTGPGNLFFRNRAELYGVLLFSSNSFATDSQAFVNNEITNNSFNRGYYVLQGGNHYTQSNNILGNLFPSNSTINYDTSYYLTMATNFIGNLPIIGPPFALGLNQNQAQTRFAQNIKTRCDYTQTPITVPQTETTQEWLAYLNHNSSIVYEINNSKAQQYFEIYDLNGKLLQKSQALGNKNSFYFRPNNSGIYIVLSPSKRAYKIAVLPHHE